MAEGHEGWDDYAPFYDWENARTLGRRDVAFWQRLVTGRGGRVLELGCGTGRVTVPLAKTGSATVVGIDRSEAMLARGQRRVRRARVPGLSLLRGDIRQLPFPPDAFDTVIAPYGILQSLLRERDLRATLKDGNQREVRRPYMRGGVHAPLSSEELDAKFLDNVLYGGWSREQGERFRDLSRRVFSHPTLDALTEFRS